jgi:hypothetical protein
MRFMKTDLTLSRLIVSRVATVLLVMSLSEIRLLAQQPAVTSAKPKFAGNPIKLNWECTESTVETLDLRCTEAQPCPLFLEWNGVASNSGRFFLTGNIHTPETTVSSFLLMSEDGGLSWTEPVERWVGAGLDDIQFVGDNGWISGQLLAPSPPKQPFFLVTTDGGVTWNRKSIRSTGSIGVVDGFWFKNSTTGSVLIDNIRKPDEGFRYELFETTSGGETWSVKQYGNKPPAERPVFQADAFIRVREDAATKSYVVESRAASGKWSAVSRFAVAAGSCRPPQRELIEPEPTPEPVTEKPIDEKPLPQPAGKRPTKPKAFH